MQIISRKNLDFKLRTTDPEDLWYLTLLIDKGDLVRGKAHRKINLSSSNEKTNVIKKTITVKISVEKINYDPEGKVLRLGGLVKDSNDKDVPNDTFQSISIDTNTVFELKKTKILKFQEDKLEESTKVQNKILLVIHDRETAMFALLNNYESKILCELSGNVQKKDQETTSSNFYKEIAEKLIEEKERQGTDVVVLASPSFFKEYVLKYLENRDKIITASCSSVSTNAIQEILKSTEIKRAISEQRLSEETRAVEELFSSMSKDAPMAYGMDEVRNAANLGAVKKLFISDKLLQQKKEEDSFYEIDEIMKITQQTDGEVMIISTTHESGERLYKLGGIGAILRYKIN